MSTPLDLQQCAAAITWVRRPPQVAAAPGCDPFAEGVLNACYNALDRHVIHGRADQAALTCRRLDAARTVTLSFAELLDRVARFGGVLRACGVGPGDVVLIALPAIPEAVVALLACARIGAVHAVAPAALPTVALCDWLQRWEPKVVVLDVDSAALAHALGGSGTGTHQPAVCVVLEGTTVDAGLGERLIDWSAAMREGAVPPAECVPLDAAHPLYVGPDQRVHPTSSVAALAWAGRYRDTVRPGQPWTPDPSADWERAHVWQVYPALIAGATAVLRDAAAGAASVGRPDWLALVDDGLAALTTEGHRAERSLSTVVQCQRGQKPEAGDQAGQQVGAFERLRDHGVRDHGQDGARCDGGHRGHHGDAGALQGKATDQR